MQVTGPVPLHDPPAPVGVAETNVEEAGRVIESCAFVAFDELQL